VVQPISRVAASTASSGSSAIHEVAAASHSSHGTSAGCATSAWRAASRAADPASVRSALSQCLGAGPLAPHGVGRPERALVEQRKQRPGALDTACLREPHACRTDGASRPLRGLTAELGSGLPGTSLGLGLGLLVRALGLGLQRGHGSGVADPSTAAEVVDDHRDRGVHAYRRVGHEPVHRPDVAWVVGIEHGRSDVGAGWHGRSSWTHDEQPAANGRREVTLGAADGRQDPVDESRVAGVQDAHREQPALCAERQASHHKCPFVPEPFTERHELGIGARPAS
jgi:hypothetical protein